MSKTKYKEEDVRRAVSESNSVKECLQKLNNRAAGGNYRTLYKYCEKWNIDISSLKSFDLKKRNFFVKKAKKVPLEKILVENSGFSRTALKARLYAEGLKERKCEMPECGQGELWHGKKISLILDHINGVWNDNRLENIRIVCPNCNAALDTFAGKNMKKKEVKVMPKKKRIGPPRKVERPNSDELLKLLWSKSTIQIAKQYKVSDVAISKWAKYYNIPKPPRGYWAMSTQDQQKIKNQVFNK